MANTNLSQLNNIEPLNLSIGDLSSSSAAIDTLMTTPLDEVGNFWFHASIILIFLILNWYFYKKDTNIQLDISRSILTSSGWCFFISAAFLLGGIISTIFPLFWFSSLILLSWLSVRSLKKQGA